MNSDIEGLCDSLHCHILTHVCHSALRCGIQGEQRGKMQNGNVELITLSHTHPLLSSRTSMRDPFSCGTHVCHSALRCGIQGEQRGKMQRCIQFQNFSIESLWR